MFTDTFTFEADHRLTTIKLEGVFVYTERALFSPLTHLLSYTHTLSVSLPLSHPPSLSLTHTHTHTHTSHYSFHTCSSYSTAPYFYCDSLPNLYTICFSCSAAERRIDKPYTHAETNQNTGTVQTYSVTVQESSLPCRGKISP